MLCSINQSVETANFKDGVNFSRNDPCIFVTYPAGAAGDLLISIIDKHYLRTGCEYYGISDTGKVHIYTTDYEMIDQYKKYVFDDQWFFDLAAKLGNRNLNYSLLDNVIFGCHMYTKEQTKYILDTFPNAKIINIQPMDYYGGQLITFLKLYKLHRFNGDSHSVNTIKHNLNSDVYIHDRVFTLPFGAIFSEKGYLKYYDQIINFLGLEGRLICYNFIKYYLSKQHSDIQSLLISYSESICSK